MQRRTVRRNPAAHTPDDLDGSDYIVARGVIGEPALSRSQRSSQHGPLSHALGTRNGNRRPTELAKSLERIIFGRSSRSISSRVYCPDAVALDAPAETYV